MEKRNFYIIEEGGRSHTSPVSEFTPDGTSNDLSWLPASVTSLDSKYSLFTERSVYLAARPSRIGDGRTDRDAACRSFWALKQLTPLTEALRTQLIGLAQNLHWRFLTTLSDVCLDLNLSNVLIQSSSRSLLRSSKTGEVSRQTSQNSAHGLGFAYDIGLPRYRQLVDSHKYDAAAKYAIDFIDKFEAKGFVCDQYILEGSHVHFGLLNQNGVDFLQLMANKKHSLSIELPVRGCIVKSLRGQALVDWVDRTSSKTVRDPAARRVKTDYPMADVVSARSEKFKNLVLLPQAEDFWRIEHNKSSD